MNILGTLFVIDAQNTDLLKQYLSIYPPPMGKLATGTVLCMDMDETTNEIEELFPMHGMKATILCPPPSAMYKEIDGDQEGFITEYNNYLDHDDAVQEFIATMLLFLHVGGNIVLYTPAFMEDEPIWMNTLILNLYTRYGITTGSITPQGMFGYAYDESYDNTISDILYLRNMIDVFDYINSTSYYPFPPVQTYNKVLYDLSFVTGPGENPYNTFLMIKNSISQNGVPIIKPGIIFDQN